ncbi:MAG: xanthine dehydrogenase family protein subunit M [Actinomyces sp.]|nr:MAG: xanthine dehydrogenase family protein subunit M [Actinomyces sp.]
MIPAAFDYVRADSADAALAALAEHGDEAKLLAGGHSLIPLMRYRLVTPGVVVDVGRLDGDLRGIRVDGDTVRIGALTRHTELEHSAELAGACPLLAHVASLVGDPAVRHRGTIGGSLAHADPASDLPAAVLALGGTLVARGPGGEREIAATDFFRGFLESALAPDEMLTEIRVPVSTGGWNYQKFNRRAQDWAIVGVAVAEGGRGVALVNMGSTPVRASAVEEAVAAGASAADAAAVAADGTEPPSDLNGDADYRRHLARVLTERALKAAGAG